MKEVYFKRNEIKYLIPIFVDKGIEHYRYLYTIDDKNYVINLFKDDDINIIKRKVYKLEKLNEYKFSKNIIIPDGIVYIDKTPSGFTTELLEKSVPFNDHAFDSTKNKIKLLLKAKELILELNNQNIIHSDIGVHNFIVKNNTPYLLDMISCEFDEFKNTNQNAFYSYYKKRIGKIDEYFDIYSFNAMTYGFLNKIAGFKIIDNIIEGNNTILKNKEITEMYYNLLLFKNKYNDDFIIDHIKQKKITSDMNPVSWT